MHFVFLFPMCLLRNEKSILIAFSVASFCKVHFIFFGSKLGVVGVEGMVRFAFCIIHTYAKITTSSLLLHIRNK